MWRFDACKHHWSGTRLPVTLEVGHGGVSQLEPSTQQTLVCYPFATIDGVATVEGDPQALALATSGFQRLHLFDVIERAEFVRRLQEAALGHVGVAVRSLKPLAGVQSAAAERLGGYGSDEHLTSLVEFVVHKIQSRRHADSVRRLLCLTETCLLERDPDSYRYGRVRHAPRQLFTPTAQTR